MFIVTFDSSLFHFKEKTFLQIFKEILMGWVIYIFKTICKQDSHVFSFTSVNDNSVSDALLTSFLTQN